jgi:hypothetical protein
VALVTGGSPKLTGVYYDDSYTRNVFQPAAQTATSTQDCTGAPGTETFIAENVDANAPSTANGQVGNRPILHNTIDPTQLPYALVNGACVPVSPNDFLRSNSIFSVAHAAGLHTAWADKHPAADQTVSGHGTPDAVDDKFMTEINADIIPPSLVDTRGVTVTFPLTNPGGLKNNGVAITDSVLDTEAYDQIKVDAILNEIDGLTSDGTAHVGTPAIFGMNFQAVSVGQKLVDHSQAVFGGYEPGTLAFTPQLNGALAFVDRAIGAMVSELQTKGLDGSTELIITAKHGQSPIDPAKLSKIGHAVTTVLKNANIKIAQNTDDDIALIWLADQSQTAAAVATLQADKAGANLANIDYVLSGPALAERFNSPLLDPRTPDLIVQPKPGTIYTTSTAKVAEHGGFAPDDTHVALLVVNGTRDGGRQGNGKGNGHSVSAGVTTGQVAPTILEFLGLDAKQLDAVQIEGIKSLPASHD